MNYETYKVGIAVCGYPGAGKSTAGELLQEKTDGVNIETGDIVRQGAAEHFDKEVSELSSDELGEYSTWRRKTDGGDYVIQDVFDYLEHNQEFPENPAIITGMRDSEVPSLCYDFFDRFILVWVTADFKTRLERLQERGRQDEADFTREDLVRRDEREDDWGTGDLYDMRDITIPNNGSTGDLVRRLNAVVELI